jgi:NTE family protein
VSDADLIVGTSAGSIVGSQLALDKTPKGVYDHQMEMSPPGRRASVPVDLSALMPLFIRVYTSDSPLQELRAEFGALALRAGVMAEEEWIAGFTAVEPGDGRAWPERFVCTAIDASDGSFVVWRENSGVPLRLAVASSCAVPGIFPPVTINGRRYFDGGIGSTTNAQVARGYDKVLIVALTGGARRASSPVAEAVERRFAAELEALRATGSKLEVVHPDKDFGEAIGVNLMDVTLRFQAAELGLRQGASEVERIREFWSIA